MEQNSLVNKNKRQMSYKENESLFCKVIKSGQIFPSNVCHFRYDHRFLFSREMRNIGKYRDIRMQKLVKFRLTEQYLLWHYQVADK